MLVNFWSAIAKYSCGKMVEISILTENHYLLQITRALRDTMRSCSLHQILHLALIDTDFDNKVCQSATLLVARDDHSNCSQGNIRTLPSNLFRFLHNAFQFIFMDKRQDHF